MGATKPAYILSGAALLTTSPLRVSVGVLNVLLRQLDGPLGVEVIHRPLMPQPEVSCGPDIQALLHTGSQPRGLLLGPSGTACHEVRPMVRKSEEGSCDSVGEHQDGLGVI